MLYGFELEVLGPVTEGLICAVLRKANIDAEVFFHPSIHTTELRWAVDSDGSIISRKSKPYTAELRSPVLTYGNKERVSQIKTVISVLKQLGCVSNHTCGLHFHISGPEITTALVEPLTRQLTNRTKPNRLRYADPNKSPNEHHAAVSIVDHNHLEVRVFNGAVDFRYIMKSLEKVKEIIDAKIKNTVCVA